MEEILLKYIGNENLNKPWNPPNLYRDKSPIEYSNDLIVFINKYSFLYEKRSLDFFDENIWDKLIPDEWKESLLSMTDNECVLFHNGLVINDWWPSSLKQFINEATSLWMPKDTVYLQDENWEFKSVDQFKLDSLFLGMSDKKIHEILRMSEFVNCVAQHLKPDEIVDIGAGEAYLTQILNHHFNYSLTAIDCSESFIQGAIKRQNVIENQRIKKELKQGNSTIVNDLKSTTMCISTISTTMKDNDFINLLKSSNNQDGDVNGNGNDDGGSSSKNYKSIMLIGLHTCGNLPFTMIKNYIQCNNIDSIIDVGCCYYKINQDENHQFLSDHCISTNLQLGPAPLKLSCEASDTSQKDIESYQYSNRIHFYRVVLESWLKSQLFNGENHNFTIRGLSKTQSSSLENYLSAALSRMKRQQTQPQQPVHTDILLPDTIDPILSFYKDNFKSPSCEKQVSIFLLLRSLLAPVLESLIVLDRWIYLDQFSSTTSSFIIPIFNKKISPRNLILLSFKK